MSVAVLGSDLLCVQGIYAGMRELCWRQCSWHPTRLRLLSYEAHPQQHPVGLVCCIPAAAAAAGCLVVGGGRVEMSDGRWHPFGGCASGGCLASVWLSEAAAPVLLTRWPAMDAALGTDE